MKRAERKKRWALIIPTCLLKAHQNLATGTLFPASFFFHFERDKKEKKKGEEAQKCM